jgi:endonuclease G
VQPQKPLALQDTVTISSNAGKIHSKWVANYDPRSRNPRWALEHLYKYDIVAAKASKVDRKKSRFHPEPLIQSPKFRMLHKDYTDSGYDRGHMVPAGDFMNSQDTLNDTFTMANICPQDPVLNRGLWAELEGWLRQTLEKHFDEMIIITGPVYAPVFYGNQWVYMHKTIGTYPRLITVPTHFFKVFIGKRHVKTSKSGTEIEQYVAGAFMVPNGPIEGKDITIEDFLVKIDQLESIVGFEFFPKCGEPHDSNSKAIAAMMSPLDEKSTQKLDQVVPDSRDLSIVLNANLTRDSVLALPDGIVDKNRQGEQRRGMAKENNTASSQRRTQMTAPLLHICEVTNCKLPFFPKSKQ